MRRGFAAVALVCMVFACDPLAGDFEPSNPQCVPKEPTPPPPPGDDVADPTSGPRHSKLLLDLPRAPACENSHVAWSYLNLRWRQQGVAMDRAASLSARAHLQSDGETCTIRFVHDDLQPGFSDFDASFAAVRDMSFCPPSMRHPLHTSLEDSDVTLVELSFHDVNPTERVLPIQGLLRWGEQETPTACASAPTAVTGLPVLSAIVAVSLEDWRRMQGATRPLIEVVFELR